MGADGPTTRPLICGLCLSERHATIDCDRPYGDFGVPPRFWCKARVWLGPIPAHCTKERGHAGEHKTRRQPGAEG